MSVRPGDKLIAGETYHFLLTSNIPTEKRGMESIVLSVTKDGQKSDQAISMFA
jgi:hypothetical protein